MALIHAQAIVIMVVLSKAGADERHCCAFCKNDVCFYANVKFRFPFLCLGDSLFRTATDAQTILKPMSVAFVFRYMEVLKVLR